MGVVCVHRWAPSTSVNTNHQQELSFFTIGGYHTFEFGSGPTWTAGTYSFLHYATTDATQAQLTAYGLVSPPSGFTNDPPVLDTVNQRVTIKLIPV